MFNNGQKQPGILDAPPRTTFFLGLFVGITVTAIIAIVVMVPMLNASGSKTGTTGTTNTVAAGNDTNNAVATTASFTAPSSKTDYYRGEKPEDADVVMVEYSDFQCPFCQTLHPTLKQLLSDYDGKISWVYRHYPLTSIHPNAQPAAEASECIGNLGGNDAFWAFADGVFGNQSAMSDSFYQQLATQAGVNESKYTDCYSKKQYDSVISTDVSEGSASGISGTPGTFILPKNDVSKAQLISGALPIDSFKQAIDAAL